ncbi:MAG: HDOD domain-containing protein [Actinomycetota bacterium]|uniref:HDOD domain-containing protein n=1 Tax=Euzebya pacifica TaxID=1608957 RepID=UPI0030F7BEBB
MHVLFVDENPGRLTQLAGQVASTYRWNTTTVSTIGEVVGALTAERWDALIAADDEFGDGSSALALARLKQPSATRCLVRLGRGNDPSSALAVAEIAHRVLDDVPSPASLRAMLVVMGVGGMRAPQDLVDTIGAVAGLPSVARILTDLKTILTDPTCSADRVAAIVRTEPAIAAKVLHLANAGLAGRVGTVHDLEQAAALLGMRVLRQVVLASAAFTAAEQLGVDPTLVAAVQRHGVAVAAAAIESGTLPPHAAVGGLLLDIGLPLMALTWPDVHADLRQMVHERSVPLHVEEMRVLGTSHAEAGALLARRWSLPTGVVEMIAGHHFVPRSSTPERRALGYVVHRAAQLGDPAGRDIHDHGVEVDVPEWVDRWRVEDVERTGPPDVEL